MRFHAVSGGRGMNWITLQYTSDFSPKCPKLGARSWGHFHQLVIYCTPWIPEINKQSLKKEVTWDMRKRFSLHSLMNCQGFSLRVYNLRIGVKSEATFPRVGRLIKIVPTMLSPKSSLGVVLWDPNCIVKIKELFCWIHQVIRVALKLWWQNYCSKMWKRVVFPFQNFPGGVFDSGKQRLVTADSLTGQR